MKITIPIIVKALYLREYHDEMGDQVIYVWVNPPREKREVFYAIVNQMQMIQEEVITQEEFDPAGLAEQVNVQAKAMFGWLAEMWSQHSDPDTHWTAEEVSALAEQCADTDPAFYTWLQTRTSELIRAHREINLKK